MKVVRLNENTVVEVIPEYALPVEQWYGETFAAQCVEAPDEVEQHWTYDPETGAWAEPVPYVEPTPEPETEPSVWDELDEAYQEGVNSVD